MENDFFFQLFEAESSTFTYLIGDYATKEAALIDSVIETHERDFRLIEELNLQLKYILDTHVHADHITGAAMMKKKTKALIGISALASLSCADINLDDDDELILGKQKIRAITTPGHTDSCISFYWNNRVFTGDTLLIRGSGRTDFQQGSNEKLFHSVREKLFKLPDSTLVYPAHDYKGFTSSSIFLEKKFNPRLGLEKTFEDFQTIMQELKLPYPKKIEQALPANLSCGLIKT